MRSARSGPSTAYEAALYQPAFSDLDAILDYIAANSPQGAARVHARIKQVIDLLLPHPGIGSQTDDPAVRRIAASPYPYLVFFQVAGDEIIVHAVRHGARDPSGMPDAR